MKFVHKLVAETFIENSNSSLVVNHINGIKTDNRVENLEWCTQKHNVNEAWKMGFKKGGVYLYNTRPIYQFDMNMKFIKKYESQTEASKLTGIHQGDISKCCLGKRNKAGNYIWKFDDGILNELERLQKDNYKLDRENQQLKKGINSLMQSRKKWKDRYYKLKTENCMTD